MNLKAALVGLLLPLRDAGARGPAPDQHALEGIHDPASSAPQAGPRPGTVPDGLHRPTDVRDSWKTRLFELHRRLVEIESISNHEHAVGRFLQHYLHANGLTVERQQVPRPPSDRHVGPARPDRPRYNIYAHAGGPGEARVVLTSHIDTVPPFYPYTRHDDGSIGGRGVVDAKACVAAQVIAALQLMTDGPAAGVSHPIALLFVVGEERGGDGMRKVNELGRRWDAVIFGEPTEFKLVTGHKGNLGFSLTATGKGGHSGYPEVGKNANLVLVRALTALADMTMPWSEKYGNSSLNIGWMEGGVAGNVIAERARAAIQIRVADGTADEMKELVLRTVEGVDRTIAVQWLSDGYGPVDIDSDIDGFEKMTVNYGTDIPNLRGDHKRYLYGPGSILVAHSDHEALFPEDLVTAVHGYKKIARAALGMEY